MRTFILLAVLFLFIQLGAQQPYQDYIGAGHTQGIVTMTSSDLVKADWIQSANGLKSISGAGLEGPKSEMARLLHQASMGFSKDELDHAVQLGVEGWINEQLDMPSSEFLGQANRILAVLNEYYIQQGEDPDNLPEYPSWKDFRYGWYQNAVFNPDQLRQRMTFSLSQIFVISDETDLAGHGDAMASYYDMLSKHAFGNYRDLLFDVTMHPSMGFYLSHLNNPREIPEENIHPDQNYAREVMQLFSIGLFQLNIDGSPQLDADGDMIPTYDNNDIAEMAKIFTGLGIGGLIDPVNSTLYFGRGLYDSDNTVPMIMYEEWHQQGEKTIIDGIVIPDGQTGLEDINDAIDVLFNHQNVGPFISRQLIQRFVTSNPTSGYIQRVAETFNDDGNGVRGNMAAVVKAILLDEEARECEYLSDLQHGKMSEPVIRNTHYYKAIGISQIGDEFLNHGYNYGRNVFQAPLSSPSVFNFYTPDYTPVGPISDDGLVAPEFQIYNSISAIQYPNWVFSSTYWENSANHWEDDTWNTYTNAFDFIEPSLDSEVLINELDMLFCNGNLSDDTRQVVKEAVDNRPGVTLDEISERIKLAIYLILISPDYIIHK